MQLPEWIAASACPAPEDVCVLVGIPDVLLAACSFGGQGVVCLAAWLFGGRTGARILGKPPITPIQAELSAHSSGPHLRASVYAGCVRTWRIPGSSYNPHLHRQGALWHCLAKLLILSAGKAASISKFSRGDLGTFGMGTGFDFPLNACEHKGLAV